MPTAVYTPAAVWTVSYICLCTVTPNLFQPNLSSTHTVEVGRLRSDVPDSIASNNSSNIYIR